MALFFFSAAIARVCVSLFANIADLINTHLGEFRRCFSGRLESVDFFSGKESSVLRNPLLAETLYKCHEIERWGMFYLGTTGRIM